MSSTSTLSFDAVRDRTMGLTQVWIDTALSTSDRWWKMLEQHQKRSSSSTASTAATLLMVLGTATAAVVTSLVAVQLGTSADPLGRCWTFWKQLAGQERRLTSSDSVHKGVTEYQELHKTETSAEVRNAQYQALVNAYYDLATVFYEWGWGSSFHFSYQFNMGRSSFGEGFDESIRRHEYQLVSHLGSGVVHNPTAHILDVGCGIGGPMRNIARFLQCGRITGITLNPYQVQRGNELSAAAGLSHMCHAMQGDFMQLPLENNSLDGAYAIEATCHAPDRVACYKQVYDKLKPGAYFACYEWCLTDLYDPSNADHVRMKRDIELGNGLPDCASTRHCWEALQKAGFEPILERDLAATVPQVQPWYTPLMPSWNPLSQRFQFNPVGAVLTNVAIATLEFVRLAPAGTVQTQKVLQAGGFALRDAGQVGIFTTMYLMVGRKPVSSQ